MKKQILLTITACATAFAVHAQKRNCGTMEYHELRKLQNPMLEQVMQQQEALIRNATGQTVYPAIEGFTPTGTERDRELYRAAKERMLAGKPKAISKYSETELARMREEKRTRYYLIH